MQRAIKFRAWDKRDNVFRYNIVIENNGKESIYLNARKGEIVFQQYTGLKDKNGKEIYEGDIVHIEKDRFGKGKHEVWSVEYALFGEPRFGVWNQLNSCRDIEADGQRVYFNADGTKDIEITVQGNIYENPELIASQEQKE